MPETTKAELEKRIQDWKNRISSLYNLIEKWIESMDGYRVERQKLVRMHEELMQNFLMRPENLKVLDIYYRDRIVVTVKPVALWVLGANGRLDILYKNGAVILVDQAKSFKTPKWVAFSTGNRKDGQIFNESYFIRLLRE